jgi:arylsulfatase A-like enzyme
MNRTATTASLSERGPAVLLSAAWFAVLGGMVEATWHAFRWFVLGDVVKLSSHFAWMAPLGNLIVFAPAALGLLLLHKLAPSFFTRARTAGFFAFMAMFGVMLMFGSVHRVAMVVLAVGLGVQTVRSISARPARASALMRPTLAWMIVAAASAGIGLALVRGIQERRSLAALPAAPANATNIVLLILDTVRAASLGLYGYEKPTTPHLEAFARDGITFERALSTSPWTLPSHSAMFTGRYPHEVTANWETPLDDEFPTLAETLSDQGWATAGFVSNIFYADRPNGLGRGFAHYEDYRTNIGEVLNASSLGAFVFAGRPGFTFNPLRNLFDDHVAFGFKDAHRVNDDFLDWLDERPDDQPFFAFLNYLDAHYPYVSPPDLRREFQVEERWTYNDRAYEAAIASVDRALGALVDSLRQRNLADSTIIIIASDHGEHVGEKDRTGHGNSLYMENLHVPLVIVYPGAPGNVRIDEMVTLRSLPATILDLAGTTERGGIPGSSLRALWEPQAGGQVGGTPRQPAAETMVTGSATTVEPERNVGDPLIASARRSIRTNEDLPIFDGDLHTYIENGLQFIHNGDETEELYDLRTDFRQERDLIRVDSTQSLLSVLRARATALMPGIRTGTERNP